MISLSETVRQTIIGIGKRVLSIKESTTAVRPRVLVLGDVAAVEMQPVMQAVMTVFAGSEIRVSSFEAGISTPDDDSAWSPDLVFVCQCEPDEYTRDDVLALITRHPLARLVCCFGLWCEADGRTRDLWPMSVRATARSGAMRIRRESDVLYRRQIALPLTAGREEAFEFDTEFPSDRRLPSGQNATVVSPDRELRMSFEDRLRSLGFCVDRKTAPNVILFDADPWNDITRGALQRTRGANSQAAIFAMMNFARPEDVHDVTRAGADDVLAKLVNQEQLAATCGSGLLRHLHDRRFAGQ